MPSGTKGAGSSNSFRERMQRVMQRFNTSEGDSYELSATSPQQLLHRLRLEQIELEKQKEEVRRSQAALDHSRARFIDLLEYTSALYNQAPVGYLTLAHDGTIVEANQTAVTLLGVRRALLLQRLVTDFIVEDDREGFYTFYREVLSAPGPLRGEVRMRRADGLIFYVQVDALVTKSILRQEHFEDAPYGGPYVRITLIDITERVELETEERLIRKQLESALEDLRQTQELLVKQERMAVVGQLAAGIAHDFNNIMASITLYTQLVMRAPDLPPALNKRMEAILTQSKRAADLVQQMLDFGRRTVMTRQSTALLDFLQQLVDLLRDMLPDTIQVRLEDCSLRRDVDDVVEIDTGRMQQVIFNLALNSRDAMPEGGELRLALSRLQVGEDGPTVASGTLSPGAWLRLDVIDTGTGIHPEDLPHIFEPFFSTKEIGIGSGLGLSQVYGLVKQHEGEIDVRSTIGQGTTFSIYLRTSAVAPAHPPAKETVEVPHGHGELVLVVEDSDFLRAAEISVLTQLGYRTRVASNGQEAFDLLLKESDKVDLILTDLSMPIMGGKELIRAVRRQNWQHPIVVLTGQPLSQAEIVQLESYGRVSRMQKPVVMERLARELHYALNKIHHTTAG